MPIVHMFMIKFKNQVSLLQAYGQTKIRGAC